MGEIQWGPDVTDERKRQVLLSRIEEAEKDLRVRQDKYERAKKASDRAVANTRDLGSRVMYTEDKLREMRFELVVLLGGTNPVDEDEGTPV